MVLNNIYDLKLQAGLELSDCIFYEPKEFRNSHLADEILFIDTCKDITIRRLPARVPIVFTSSGL
jgi:hypothetical protein